MACSSHGSLAMTTSKPAMPAKISTVSETKQVRQMRKTCSRRKPCRSTKAFCEPMARISERLRLNPAVAALNASIMERNGAEKTRYLTPDRCRRLDRQHGDSCAAETEFVQQIRKPCATIAGNRTLQPATSPPKPPPPHDNETIAATRRRSKPTPCIAACRNRL